MAPTDGLPESTPFALELCSTLSAMTLSMAMGLSLEKYKRISTFSLLKNCYKNMLEDERPPHPARDLSAKPKSEGGQPG